MKTFAFLNIGILSFTLASIASADDFLARATQGKLSDNTKGIHALSETESKGVKGGYAVFERAEFRNWNLGGGTSIVEIGYGAVPTQSENDRGVICSIGYSGCSDSSINKNRYNELISLANPYRGEYLFATATKTTRQGMFGISIPSFSYGFLVYNARTGAMRRVTGNPGYVGKELMSRYKNEMGRILVTQYR